MTMKSQLEELVARHGLAAVLSTLTGVMRDAADNEEEAGQEAMDAMARQVNAVAARWDDLVNVCEHATVGEALSSIE
jgi:hypothetical protein